MNLLLTCVSGLSTLFMNSQRKSSSMLFLACSFTFLAGLLIGATLGVNFVRHGIRMNVLLMIVSLLYNLGLLSKNSTTLYDGSSIGV